MSLTIERIGRTTGRWPSYRLIVDGVDVGQVRRTITGGGDNMAPRVRRDGWEIQGIIEDSRDRAEQALIRRAIRFGYLQEA